MMERTNRTALMRPSTWPLTRPAQDDEICGLQSTRHPEQRPQAACRRTQGADHTGRNNKNSGGNTMSLKKSATHRLGLMAGSSLVAATLSTFAFTGAALAPTAVFAANECTPIGVSPSANAAAPDSYTCSAASYATGITYSSDGALTVTKTNTTATTITSPWRTRPAFARLN